MARPRSKRTTSAEDEFDEIVAVSSPVLRRDAAKTDYLVIPLFAGVLARCMLARGVADAPDEADGDEHENALSRARQVIDLATPGQDGWENDTAAYGVVASLLFLHEPALLFFHSVSYIHTTLGLPFAGTRERRLPALLDWLGTTPPPSLTETALISAYVAMAEAAGRRGELAVLSREVRRVRVVLADRLRREGLTTWPRVLAAAVNDWNVPTLEHLAHELARSGDAFLHDTIAREPDRRRADEELTADTTRFVEAVKADAALRVELAVGDTVADAEDLVARAAAEIADARAAADRVQGERDRLADRLARAQSRIEHLETELGSAVRARDALDAEVRQLRREREESLESAAADEVLATPAIELPAHAFDGRRVLVFTGVESASARAAMHDAFAALGAAQVDVYHADRSRGPDIIAPDVLFALEVSHMGHSTWEAIRDRARRAGAWVYSGRHGAATIARATAAAWLAHARVKDEPPSS